MYTPSQQVLSQKERVPEIYGNVDFTVTPERFAGTAEDESELGGSAGELRGGLLENATRMAKVREYTMMGDAVADAYATLIPEYGFRKLVSMLETACDQGLDAVTDAPPQLVDLIQSMAHAPDWLDMNMVQRGAQLERNEFANFSS